MHSTSRSPVSQSQHCQASIRHILFILPFLEKEEDEDEGDRKEVDEAVEQRDVQHIHGKQITTVIHNDRDESLSQTFYDSSLFGKDASWIFKGEMLSRYSRHSIQPRREIDKQKIVNASFGPRGLSIAEQKDLIQVVNKTGELLKARTVPGNHRNDQENYPEVGQGLKIMVTGFL